MADNKQQSMKAKEIQDLINFISETGLEEVNIETEQLKLKVKRSSPSHVTTVAAAAPAPAPAPAPVAAAPAPAATPTPAAAPAPAAPAANNLVKVKSPMIGTFYRSANPESPSFVNVGDVVKKGQVVCIIEAMKLFNEIESDVSGRIVEVLVDNANPVEFDQPLFLVDPS
jgi:acetyl-CoA carboxylase biotin carboxyl carrier protein